MADAQITIRLQARARGDEIVGMRDGVLLARVSAPPVDGRANRALCKLIARWAGVAPSKVTIVRGERSREKLISVLGVDTATLTASLQPGDAAGVKRRARTAASGQGRPSAREGRDPRT